MPDRKVIVIEGAEPGLPYSKGLRASELMVTGLPPYRSYQVAEKVEERLLERKVASVTAGEQNERGPPLRTALSERNRVDRVSREIDQRLHREERPDGDGEAHHNPTL